MSRSGASIYLFLLGITLAGCDQTPSSQAHVRVLSILEKRQYPEAVRMVEAALQKDPKNRELLEDRLIFLLANRDRAGRARLLETQKRLEAVGGGRQLLIDQSLSSQTFVRQQVAWLLGVLNDRGSMETLRFLAEDREAEVRSEAIRSLAKFRDPKNRRLLFIRLRDVNWMVRAESAAALAIFGDKTASPQLFRSANDKDNYARSQVLEAILAVADLSQKRLYLDNLEADEPGKRTAAALALLKLQQPEAVPVLLELLKNPETPDRAKIAVALSQADLPSLADDFEILLRSEKNAVVRRALLDYFSRRSDTQAVRILKKSR